MRRKGRCFSFLALCLLVLALAAPGSNRGFLIHMPLVSSYYNVVSLPYNTRYATAKDIFTDIPNCIGVSRWDPTIGSCQTYCGGSGTGFTPVPGEALQITASQNTTWVVVGTYNNAARVQLYKIPDQVGDWPYDWNWIAPPYHTRAKTASDLFREIPNCLRVSRWNSAQGIFERWDGTNQYPDNINFIITPGEGYSAKVSADCTWTPTHY